MTVALAFDLGGTRLRAGLVDRNGQVLQRNAVMTDVAGGPTAVAAQMASMAAELRQQVSAPIIAAGVSSPGPIDTTTATYFDLPTLPGWKNFPLKQTLQASLDVPVTLENDGISAAIGEWQFGAGKGLSDMVYVTVSTGIGGGIISGGQVVRGQRGMASHVGHLAISQTGPVCNCGCVGCFEALAAGPAFNAEAVRGGYASAEAAVAAARTGDTKAISIVQSEAEILGYGFVSLIHLFSPQMIVMGGGVSQAFDLLAPVIEQQINRLAMPSFRAVKLVKAALGDNAGLVGAAALALGLAGSAETV